MDTFAYDFVERLSFNRVAGTPAEEKAALIIKEEVEKLGGSAELMEFEIPSYVCHHVSASAMGKDLDVTCYGRSGNINADLKLLYLEKVNEITLRGIKDLSDTCVMLNTLDKPSYEQLLKLKAACFMVISGKWYFDEKEEDMMPRMLRDRYTSLGLIPGLVIRAKDAMMVLKNECESIHVEMETEDTTGTSRNVVAVIEGSEVPEETIMVTGHFDSVAVGTGSWDNATGSAAVLYMYRYFLTHQPKRTLRFVWCGAEEIGLIGSKTYLERNEELVDQIKFVFNFDMNGTIFGPNIAFLTGNDDLKSYFDALCREYGYCTDVRVGVHSSDSAPFCRKGIPALGIGRGGMAFSSFHTRYDVFELLSAKEMNKNMEFAAFCIDRFVNSVFLPIPTGLNEKLVKEIEEYFA